jgi:hypothetical protein
LHYVKKCSGQYENNRAAARYVHQMAEEVLNLLAGVAGELRKNKNEPEVFQALLDEWHSSFPASLGNLGTPKAIAALISKQSQELAELKESLAHEKSRRENDIREILDTMDGQLQAYRASVVAERLQQKMIESQALENYEVSIEQFRQKSDAEIVQLKNSHREEMKVTRARYETIVSSWQDKHNAFLQKYDSDIAIWRTRYDQLTEKSSVRTEKLRRKIKEAQDKYYALSHSVHDDFSIMSSGSKDTNDDGATDDGTRVTEASLSAKQERQKTKRKEKILRELAANELKAAAVLNATPGGTTPGGDGMASENNSVVTGGTALSGSPSKGAPRMISSAAFLRMKKVSHSYAQ